MSNDLLKMNRPKLMISAAFTESILSSSLLLYIFVLLYQTIVIVSSIIRKLQRTKWWQEYVLA